MLRSFKVCEKSDGSEKIDRLACHVNLQCVHIVRKTRSNGAKTDTEVGTNSG